MSTIEPEGHNKGNEEEARLFLASLGDHIRRSTGLELGKSLGMKIPKMHGLPISLFSLYAIVRAEGGFDRVTKAKGWRQIAQRLIGVEPPANSGYIIRNHYERLLLHYEREESRPTGQRQPFWASGDHKRPLSKSPVGFDNSTITVKRARTSDTGIYDGPTLMESRPKFKGSMAKSCKINVPTVTANLGVESINKDISDKKSLDISLYPIGATVSRKERKSGIRSIGSAIGNKHTKAFPFRSTIVCSLCQKDCFDIRELGPQIRIDWLSKGIARRFQAKLSTHHLPRDGYGTTWSKGDLSSVHGLIARILPNPGPMIFLEPWYEEVYEFHLEHFLGSQNTKADRAIALNILTILSTAGSTKWHKRLFLPRLADICERYLSFSRKCIRVVSRSRGKSFSEIIDARYGLLDEYGCIEVDDTGDPQSSLNSLTQRWWEDRLFSVDLEAEGCISEEAKAALLILSNVSSSAEEAVHLAADARLLKLLFSFAEDAVYISTTMGITFIQSSEWDSPLESSLSSQGYNPCKHDMTIYWEALNCLQNLSSKLDLIKLQDYDAGPDLIDQLFALWEEMFTSANILFIRYCCVQISSVVEVLIDVVMLDNSQSFSLHSQKDKIPHKSHDILRCPMSNKEEKRRKRASHIFAKLAHLIPYLLQSLEYDEEITSKCLGVLYFLSKGDKKTMRAITKKTSQLLSILERASMSQKDNLILLHILNAICSENPDLWSSLEERLIHLSMSTDGTSKLASELLLWRRSPSLYS